MSWVTIREASGYLKVSRSTLYRWAREGRVRLHHLGQRSVRVRKEDLDSLAEVDRERMTRAEGTLVTPRGGIWKLVGIGKGPPDLASEHDRHLALHKKRR